MARAYGDDLREKVLAAYAAGKRTLRQLAERFDVSCGWVAKIHAAELGTGRRRRVPQRRRPSLIDTKQVRRIVKAKPGHSQRCSSMVQTPLWRLHMKKIWSNAIFLRSANPLRSTAEAPMASPEPISDMTNEEFKRRSLDAIQREFGLGGLARFLMTYRSGKRDYTRDRHHEVIDAELHLPC